MQHKLRNILALMLLSVILVMGLAACNNSQTVAQTNVEINSDGYWVINGENTGVKAQGTDGSTVSVEINSDGFWVIGGVVTEVSAVGKAPIIEINSSGFWVINGVVTNVCALGKDGISPNISISDDGYWVVNGTKTDTIAKGEKPEVSISESGCWVIDGEETNIVVKGTDGKGVFELYKEIYGYDGTVEEWLDDILSGTIGTAEKRTVTFDYNGLEPSDGLPEEIEIVDGRTLTLPLPEREGHKFLGWFTGVGVNDGQWLNTYAVTADLNLIAKWQQNSYTVRFETENGELLKEENVKYGESATPPSAPHIDNYSFSHWDGEYAEITADIVLKPVYVPTRYTVTFDTDGGNEIASESYLFSEIPVKPIAPQKQGFVFGGWKIADSDEMYTFDAPLTGDVTLVAVWTDTISISDVEELLAIADNMEAKYSLANDINLKGAEWTPLGEFKGVLDGCGHKIYNFTMSTAAAQMGFFQTNSGTIRNLVFSDVAVNNSYAGVSNTAIVAAVNNATISDIIVRESTITRSYSATNVNHDGINVGGIVGINNGEIVGANVDVPIRLNVTLKNYREATSFNACSYCGSVVGKNTGKIANALVLSNIVSNILSDADKTYYGTTVSQVNTYIGGAIGMNDTGSIEDISSNVAFDLTFTNSGDGTPKQYRRIGGVVGYNRGEIKNAYSSGNITMRNTGNNITDGGNDMGGITGNNIAGAIIDVCMSSIDFDYSASSVNGSLGGLVGVNESSAIVSNCIYDGHIVTEKMNNPGGLIGTQNGTLSNSIFKGEIRKNSETTSFGGLVGVFNSSGSILRCINDGQLVAASGSPQYIASTIDGRTVTKCYRTENATLTVGEELTDGAQADSITLKEAAELYVAEFIYDTLLFDEDVWGLENGEPYLKALADYIGE